MKNKKPLEISFQGDFLVVGLVGETRNGFKLKLVADMQVVDFLFGCLVFAHTLANVFIQDGVGKTEVVLVRFSR